MTINERLVILVTQKSDEPSEGMTNFGRYLEKEYKKYYQVLVIDPKQIFKHNIDKKYHNNNIIIYALGPSFTSLITTEPIPIKLLEPIFTPFLITEPAPIKH